MQAVLVGAALLAALALIALGVRLNSRPPAPPPLKSGASGRGFWRRWGWAIRRRPAPVLGWLETGLWLLLLASLVNHLASPQHSLTAGLIGMITLLPHEAGHMLCSPFGLFLGIAGGSIWQVFLWLLLGSYAYFIRRHLTLAMAFGVVVGHSFINMSVYIADARTRHLTLLFGLVGPEGHDWWNLLRLTGLLEYDQILAGAAILLGAVIAVAAMALGLLATWFLPHGVPFQGYPFPALAAAWQAAGEENSNSEMDDKLL
jgi:hypothetical protein